MIRSYSELPKAAQGGEIALFVDRGNGFHRLRTYEGGRIHDEKGFQKAIAYLEEQAQGWKANGSDEMRVAVYEIRPLSILGGDTHVTIRRV